MALSDRDQEILAINQAMLESVANGDWSRYAGFCAADLSCFEAETNGHLVEGLPFQQYYSNLHHNHQQQFQQFGFNPNAPVSKHAPAP